MYLCYIDEAGCTGPLPSPTSNIQPAFTVTGIILNSDRLSDITTDFLKLKQQFKLNNRPPIHYLDGILSEVKGSTIRKEAVSSKKKEKRRAIGFLDKFIELLNNHDVLFISRVWIKGPADEFKGQAIYAISIQNLCKDFDHFLENSGTQGLVILDSRNKPKNANVSHSIFTQKFKNAGGDEYRNLVETPIFGHSDNHAGLQLADLLCSAIILPIAIHTYCEGIINSTHVRPGYSSLKKRYSVDLRLMQYRYLNSDNKWRGGVTVSDRLRHYSSAEMFK